MRASEQLRSSVLPSGPSVHGRVCRTGEGKRQVSPYPVHPYPNPHAGRAGVDPKSIVCEFFRHGKCTKGFKCKFAHDLAVERKGGKIDIFSDRCARPHVLARRASDRRARDGRAPPQLLVSGPETFCAECAVKGALQRAVCARVAWCYEAHC
jgi:hypothetical protein